MGGKGKKRRRGQGGKLHGHNKHQKPHHHHHHSPSLSPSSPSLSSSAPPTKRPRLDDQSLVARIPISKDGIEHQTALFSSSSSSSSSPSSPTLPSLEKKLGGIPVSEKKKVSIAKHRQLLPIYKGRKSILDHIRENESCVIVGETGSGKTTQIPQYIYEAGLHKSKRGTEMIIGITQPRRVAAMSVSRRVAEEMHKQLGGVVGYSVRFDSATSPQTKVKFLTDGMLMREAMLDKSLRKYSVIILDEAHERTLQTDILFSVLKRIQRERKEEKKVPLKIIIMSATLEADSFAKFFNAQVLYIEGRQFPVTTYYTHEPQPDYLDATFVTCLQLHLEKPLGDILVFLPGKGDIEAIQKLLSAKRKLFEPQTLQMEIYPIFSALPHEQQMKVFRPAPPGCRKIILATNIAETSLTINGIRYVIDCGLCKQRCFNPKTGIDSLLVTPISKAAARQRTGRAGREAPGFCYRLFPESSYQELFNATIPEIQRCALDHVVLQLKAIGVNDVLNFEYMNPPPVSALKIALRRLLTLGALDRTGAITEPVGRQMAALPLLPMFSKAILTASELGVIPQVLRIVAMLSEDSSSIFVHSSEKNASATAAKRTFVSGSGDHFTLLKIFRLYEMETVDKKQWCHQNFLQPKSLKRAREVLDQLIGYCNNLGLSVPPYEAKSEDEEEIIDKVKRAFVTGFQMQAALRQPDGTFMTVTSPQVVSIHPSSSLIERKPDCVIFTEVVLTTKLYIRDVLVVERTHLHECAPQLFSSLVVWNNLPFPRFPPNHPTSAVLSMHRIFLTVDSEQIVKASVFKPHKFFGY